MNGRYVCVSTGESTEDILEDLAANTLLSDYISGKRYQNLQRFYVEVVFCVVNGLCTSKHFTEKVLLCLC